MVAGQKVIFEIYKQPIKFISARIDDQKAKYIISFGYDKYIKHK